MRDGRYSVDWCIILGERTDCIWYLGPMMIAYSESESSSLPFKRVRFTLYKIDTARPIGKPIRNLLRFIFHIITPRPGS